MTIYKDALSGDVLLNSSYEITPSYQGLIYEVRGESARNLEEELKLMETSYSLKDFLNYFRVYITKIAELVAAKDSARLMEFKSQASVWMKEVQASFTDYRFYMGESFPDLGLVILRKDGELEEDPPRYYYLKDGMIAESA